jgi:hypothetical protein
MNSSRQDSLAFLEHRLALLQQLGDALDRASRAILGSDRMALELWTIRQQELCQELRSEMARESDARLADGVAADDLQPPRWLQLPAETFEPGLRRRWDTLNRELAEVQMRVYRLNQIHGSLVRRARRTVDVFCRLLSSSELTYGPPSVRGRLEPGTSRE